MKRKLMIYILISVLALAGCGEQEKQAVAPVAGQDPDLAPMEEKLQREFKDYSVVIKSLIMAAGTKQAINFQRDDGILTSNSDEISVTSKDESILKIEKGFAGVLVCAQKAGTTSIVIDYRGIIKEKEITVVETPDPSFFYASDEQGNPIKKIQAKDLETTVIYMTVMDMLEGQPQHDYGTISYSDMFMQAEDFNVLTDSDALGVQGEQFTVISAKSFNPVAAPSGTITVLLVDENDGKTVYGMAEWKVN